MDWIEVQIMKETLPMNLVGSKEDANQWPLDDNTVKKLLGTGNTTGNKFEDGSVQNAEYCSDYKGSLKERKTSIYY